ncbi:PREDICTED: uncharacterized protein LOC106628036 isoform X2 [Pseudopodoces humilis]|uniref:uncharacterized protein LOC106628036 isoform X2 n=1 Tax=Pseudopodoces humilis TaxID=181119 RepID=UPI0006B764EE|nr:PREDICTED: uncharacterized protein LOC106628036 isoform X2 [Pseudopodoces humilis]
MLILGGKENLKESFLLAETNRRDKTSLFSPGSTATTGATQSRAVPATGSLAGLAGEKGRGSRGRPGAPRRCLRTGQSLPAGAQQPPGKNPFHDQGRRQHFYSPVKRLLLEMIFTLFLKSMPSLLVFAGDVTNRCRCGRREHELSSGTCDSRDLFQFEVRETMGSCPAACEKGAFLASKRGHGTIIKWMKSEFQAFK